ncbi:MAG: hypothetical protein WCJ62_13575 [Flavobacterium sp.]
MFLVDYVNQRIYLMPENKNNIISYRGEFNTLLCLEEERIKQIFPDYYEEILQSSIKLMQIQFNKDIDKICEEKQIFSKRFNELFEQQNLILKLTGKEQLLKEVSVI